MEDKDIIKALECCSGIGKCIDCPYTEITECAKQNAKDVIDLINRQKADIERLQKAIQVQEIMLGNQDSMRKKSIDKAITEFAERLKAERFCHGGDLVYVDTIDQIAKELKEGVNNA